MSNVSGPSDPSNQDIGKFFNVTTNSSTPSEVNLQTLGSQIDTLESTAPSNSQRQYQESIQAIQDANLTQNGINAQAVIDIATKPTTQQGVMAALAKAGFPATQFLAAFNDNSVGGQFTAMANVINQQMGFVPNPKDPNSKYILANVLFKTLGFPIDKPQNTVYDVNQTTVPTREEALGTGPDGAWGVIVLNSSTAYDVELGIDKNPILSGMNSTQNAEDVCSSSAVGNILLSTPNLFPDPKSITASGTNPVALPLSESQNSQITQLRNSISNIDAQAKAAISSIQNSLEQLEQGNLSTVSKNNLAQVQGMVADMNPAYVTVTQLQDIADGLQGVDPNDKSQPAF